jgi:hypothetical protein
MKRSVKLFSIVIISLLLINSFVIFGVVAEKDLGNKSDKFAVKDFPIESEGEKIIGGFGEMDSRTGLPKKFADFKANAEEFYVREQNRSFLMQEWTKILAKKPVIGPIMFYTNKFFSYFNPIWKIIFGIKFSWSWSFFVALGLWVVIIIFIYYPTREMFGNKIFGLIGSVIIASLAGVSGVINRFILFFIPFIKNIFYLIFAIFIAVLFTKLYIGFIESLEKESKKESLDRADKKRESVGEVAGEVLNKMSKK